MIEPSGRPRAGRLILAVLGVAVAVLVTGCGGGMGAGTGTGPVTPTASAAVPATGGGNSAAGNSAAANSAGNWDITKMANPCDTIDQGQVSKIVGRTATPGVKLGTWPPLCKFVLQPGGTFLFIADNPLASGRIEYEQLRNSGQSIQPVSGVGDQAFWDPDANTLHIIYRKVAFKILLSGPNVPAVADAKSQTIAVARTALTRF